MSRWIDVDALPRHGLRGGLVHWKDIEDAPSIDLVHCGECELKRFCDNVDHVDDWNYCYWGRRMIGTDDEKR